MVVRPQKRATRRVSPPTGTQKTDLYRRLKRRLGRTLRSRVNRRGLVSRRKTSTYQPVRNEGSFPGSAVLQTHLQEQSRTQTHLRGVLHKQTGRYKIRRTLRSYVENPDMVQPQQCHTQSKTCTWVPQCDSGRPLKEEPNPKHSPQVDLFERPSAITLRDCPGTCLALSVTLLRLHHEQPFQGSPRLVSTSLQRGFSERELLLLKGSQQEPSTPQNGRFSNDGAWNNRWTSGIPL